MASKWDQAFLLSPNAQSSCSYGSEAGTGNSHQTINGHFKISQKKKRSYLCPRFAFGDQSCSLKQSSGFIFLLASFRPSSADQLFSLSKLVFPQVKNEKLKTLERRRQAEVLGLPPTNVSSVLLPFFCVFISMSGFLPRIKTPFTLVGPNHGHVPGFKRTKTPRKARVRLSQSSRYEQQ